MDDTEIIARQARKIEILEQTVAELEGSIDQVRLCICGIGGPLNDNKFQYSKAQAEIFFQIAEYLGFSWD